METQIKITWGEVCKEFPNLEKKLGKKHPELKKCELEVIEKGLACIDGIWIMDLETKYANSYFWWGITREGKKIIFRVIQKGSLEGIGPFLVLGTWFFVKKYYAEKFNEEENMRLAYVSEEGQKFWARFLGFKENFEAIKKNALQSGGNWMPETLTEYPSLDISYKLFSRMIEKEWKKQ